MSRGERADVGAEAAVVFVEDDDADRGCGVDISSGGDIVAVVCVVAADGSSVDDITAAATDSCDGVVGVTDVVTVVVIDGGMSVKMNNKRMDMSIVLLLNTLDVT